MACGAYMFTSDKAGVPAMLMGTFIEHMMGATGIPVVNVVNACATGQSIIREACLAVASGEYDVAIALAADKSSGGFFRPQSRDPFLDQDYVRRAIINLVENAVQAMNEARRSELDTNPVLTVGTQVQGERLEIIVADTGPGIAPELMTRIWEPLFSTKSFGVGLGLPTVKQIMEREGGGMNISSVPGQGTQALLWLPLERIYL